MNAFGYIDDELFCEKVPLARIAEEAGTPVYVYSLAALRARFRAFDSAFRPLPHLICYAVKANGNLAILRSLALEGSGADIVSGGELFRCLQAGLPPEKIVFAGVGKSVREIRYALEAGILLFNVESAEELEVIDRAAGEMGKRAWVALRVNPDVDPQTHPYISTGLQENKFGIDIREAVGCYEYARGLPHVDVVGVHQHIGSQILITSPFIEAVSKLAELIGRLRQEGHDIRYVDVGGGLGIAYQDETPPDPREYAQALLPMLVETGCTVILEPGRAIVGNAGVLVTRLLYRKKTPAKEFLIVDAAMNDLIRPSLYGAYQKILPVRRGVAGSGVMVDVVGPICETGDFLARGRLLPEMEAGDLLSIMGAGAYGFAMASNYNARPRVAEVLVRDDAYMVIRQREGYSDLVRGERIPEFLAAPTAEVGASRGQVL